MGLGRGWGEAIGVLLGERSFEGRGGEVAFSALSSSVFLQIASDFREAGVDSLLRDGALERATLRGVSSVDSLVDLDKRVDPRDIDGERGRLGANLEPGVVMMSRMRVCEGNRHSKGEAQYSR